MKEITAEKVVEMVNNGWQLFLKDSTSLYGYLKKGNRIEHLYSNEAARLKVRQYVPSYRFEEIQPENVSVKADIERMAEKFI